MLYNVRMNLTCADPGIFVRGGGGGGPGQSDKKSSDNVFFFFFFFFCPQLIMVNFKENYHFSRFQGGSNCLFPIEIHMTCDFPGGSGPPVPPSGSALV